MTSKTEQGSDIDQHLLPRPPKTGGSKLRDAKNSASVAADGTQRRHAGPQQLSWKGDDDTGLPQVECEYLPPVLQPL